MPCGMELDLVDPISVAVVRVKNRRVLVGSGAPRQAVVTCLL